MKKRFLLLFTVCLLVFSISSVFAQESAEVTDPSAEETAETEVPLSQRFASLRIRDQFNSYIPIQYYRFSPDVMFFDSIDLSYFPHENWNKTQWALLGRWTDGKNYNQIIYTDKPLEKKLIHGTDTGERRGFLNDFYLYAAVFVEDNYPKDTGSCYVYYSDSLLIGFKPSKGIMIDPESGIYEATNEYGGQRHSSYSPTGIRHALELIQELNPAAYTITQDNIENTAIGSAAFPQLNLDGEFMQDWTALTGAFRMTASPQVKAYRIEVVREDGVSTIYINGKQVYSDKDNMTVRNEEGLLVPERVSWSYGPILNPGGLTVTCSVGDFIVYGKGR